MKTFLPTFALPSLLGAAALALVAACDQKTSFSNYKASSLPSVGIVVSNTPPPAATPSNSSAVNNPGGHVSGGDVEDDDHDSHSNGGQDGDAGEAPSADEIAACANQTGVPAASFKVASNHGDVSLQAGDSFILKISGNHDTVNLSIKSPDGAPIGSGCIIVGEGNQGANGNHATLVADISVKMKSLFVLERGNHASATLNYSDDAQVDSNQADLSGNHVSYTVTGKSLCPNVVAWGNHTDYDCVSP